METIRLEFKELVFHFNKGCLSDPDKIPPWTIKTKGQTFYIWHLEADIPFSTRETPDAATKGSLKFRHGILTIDDNGNATIAKKEKEDTFGL